MANPALLEHHLQHNHYPPLSLGFIPYIQIVLERAEAGDWDTEITITSDENEDGVQITLTQTVAELVDGLHLYEFLPDDPA